MTTTHISSRVSEEQYNQIVLSGETPSEFVRKAVEDRLNNSNVKAINKKIKEYTEAIERLEIKKKVLQEKEDQFKSIPEEEISWLCETVKRLKVNPEIFEGRYNYYCNVFPKSYKVNKQDFKKLLEKIEDGQEEKMILNEMEVNKSG